MPKRKWYEHLNEYWAVIVSTVTVAWLMFNGFNNMSITQKAHAATLVSHTRVLDLHNDKLGAHANDISVLKANQVNLMQDVRVMKNDIKRLIRMQRENLK